VILGEARENGSQVTKTQLPFSMRYMVVFISFATCNSTRIRFTLLTLVEFLYLRDEEAGVGFDTLR
jgi:hypothetical protein